MQVARLLADMEADACPLPPLPLGVPPAAADADAGVRAARDFHQLPTLHRRPWATAAAAAAACPDGGRNPRAARPHAARAAAAPRGAAGLRAGGGGGGGGGGAATERVGRGGGRELHASKWVSGCGAGGFDPNAADRMRATYNAPCATRRAFARPFAFACTALHCTG
jgi:hypothetical protein